MDIVIVYHPKDSQILKYCVQGIKNIENARNIYCVSKEDSGVQGTIFIDESTYPFSKQDIESYVGSTHAGWYFQQLLKMYSYKCINGLSDTFLVLDSDTVFISPTKFIDTDGLPFYSYGYEYYTPYFEHLQKVLELEKQNDKSGICHHMIFQKKYLMEIIEKVELIHSDIFWKIMMKNVDPKYFNGSGMSEYELYFNYMIKYHPTEIKIRQLSWKNIVEIKGFKLSDLSNLSKFTGQYHFIAIHKYMFDLYKPDVPKLKWLTRVR